LENGNKAGREGQVCTVLKDGTPSGDFDTTQFQCVDSIQLSDGQITAQQLLPENKAETNETLASGAITGGTGIYRAARGIFVASNNGDTITLHIEYLKG
jgi:hypothetical protein